MRKNRLGVRRRVFAISASLLAWLAAFCAHGQDMRALLQSPLPPTPRLGAPVTGVIPGASVQYGQDGMIRRIRGLIPIPGARTAEQAANVFLEAFHGALGLTAGLTEIERDRTVDSLTGHHVIYHQVYQGLPVFQGEIGIHVDQNLNVVLVNHDLKPIRAIAPVFPPRHPERAVQAAQRAVPGEADPAHPAAYQAGVLVSDGTPSSAWRVNVHTVSPSGSWDVYVDASSGRVTSFTNRLVYATGSALIFTDNPVQSSGDPYLFYDINQTLPLVQAQRKNLTLLGLDGSGYLTGQYADTSPSSNISRAYSQTGQFNFSYTDPRFEETMAYYHTDAMERYIQGLGFTNVDNRKVQINVDGTTEDNSWYDPVTRQITFGSGGVPDAQDADIVYHENAHAIQYNQVPDFGETHEGGSMVEGFGDYWDGSHEALVGGPKSPGWDIFVGKWDATAYNPGDPAYLRRLDSKKHFPEDMDYVNFDTHMDGEIWSACLWLIRGICGKTRTDKMVLESHFYLDGMAGFVDGAEAILEANATLYGSANQSQIRQVFVDRGILDPIDSNTATYSISGTVTNGSAALAGAKVTATLKIPSPCSLSAQPGSYFYSDSQTSSTISVPFTAIVSAVKAAVNIQHSAGGQLDVYLSCPDGTKVILQQGNPSSTARNVDTSYPDKTAPATSLSAFNGKQAQGVWTLSVVDPQANNDGVLDWWTLTFSLSNGQYTTSTTSTSTGHYSLSGLTPGSYAVSASAAGDYFLPSSTPVTVGPNATSIGFAKLNNTLTSMSLSAATLYAGTFGVGSLSVSPVAPNGGLRVSVSTSNKVAAVPAYCTVGAGRSGAYFQFNTLNVASSTNVAIYAQLGPFTRRVVLTLLPAPSLTALHLSNSSVKGGMSTTATITLAAKAPAALPVYLGGGSSAMTLPAEVIIPAGSSGAQFTISTKAVSSQTVCTVAAHRGGITESASLTIAP